MAQSDTKEYNLRKSLESIARKRERGLKRSRYRKSELDKQEYEVLHEVDISIPWTGNLSKNVLLGRGNVGNRVFLKSEARTIKEQIAWLIKAEMMKKGMVFVNGKIWLKIFVQKPTAGSGDAINTLDLIADAIVEGIGVDDKWFCVRSIDWEIKKENPKIFISVGQEEQEPKHVCSYCGGIHPVSFFTKTKDGYSRTCKLCRKKK